MAALNDDGIDWQSGWDITLRGQADTHKLATALAPSLKPGSVIGLVGDLGAGKTTFVQQLAQALGVRETREVLSPTYTLVNEYPIDAERMLVHIDFYRLRDEESAQALGIDEQIARRDAVVAVEWANQLPDLMPPHTIWIKLATLSADARHCTVCGVGRPGGL